jgi:hypothetical protein
MMKCFILHFDVIIAFMELQDSAKGWNINAAWFMVNGLLNGLLILGTP